MLALALLAPLPPNGIEQSAHDSQLEVFTWKIVVEGTKFAHLLCALFGVVLVLGINTTISTAVPVSNLSIASSITGLGNAVMQGVTQSTNDYTNALYLGVILGLVALRGSVSSLPGIGATELANQLPRFAMREELIFRAGSEKWTVFERLRACLSFGLVHLTMIIVPLSAAVAIAVFGGILTCVYLIVHARTKSWTIAVRHAAIIHTVYNAIVLFLLLMVLALYPFFVLITRAFGLK